MSGKVLEFRKMDSCSSISCDGDFVQDQRTMERRLARRKRAIFHRERRRRALSEDLTPPGIQHPNSLINSTENNGSSTLTTTERNSSPETVQSPDEAKIISPLSHSSCDEESAKRRWDSQAKRLSDKTPPRCIRQSNALTDSEDEDWEPMSLLENASNHTTISRWESEASVGQDRSPDKLRRLKTWSHPDDAKVMIESLGSPPKLPSRQVSGGLNFLEDFVKSLSLS
ncbi:expressed unknown protein [Seminavis robusta]|uniref:Uncharacterized protein n=1 Tax=Seminavis robusta TaxID=568900 RepID=A0A9N8EXB7_9STRA|nr:expressed unknown protein [Seminavis robusta]|eukprot:Sro2364_g324980.1 n/a (227) ;mRNA; r:6446-7126